MAKKWLPVPGFIGFVTLIAGFLIPDYVLLLSKWNSITRYPVILNFWVGKGRVLEKMFGTGRVPGSRQTLHITRSNPFWFIPHHRSDYPLPSTTTWCTTIQIASFSCVLEAKLPMIMHDVMILKSQTIWRVIRVAPVKNLTRLVDGTMLSRNAQTWAW